MKSFARKAAGLIAINVLLVFLCEAFLSSHGQGMFLEDHYLEQSVRYFEAAADETQVLFLGNSFAYYGVDPAAVRLPGAKVHNFSFTGEPVQTTYYKVASYLRKNRLPKLRLAVIVLSRSMFADKPEIKNTCDYSRFYDYGDLLRRGDLDALSSAFFSRYKIFRLRTAFLQQVRFYGVPLEERLVRQRETLLENGYSRRDYSLSPDDWRKERLNLLAESVRRGEVDPEALAYYRELVGLLEERGVAVAFMKAPTPVLLAAQEAGPAYDPLDDETNEFVRLNFPGRPLLDYMKPDAGWRLEMFSDRGHLNAAGAKRLGEMLSRDLAPLCAVGKD